MNTPNGRNSRPKFRPAPTAPRQYSVVKNGLSNMSAQARLQHQAGETIRGLQQLPPGVWTKDHGIIFENNLLAIERMAAKPVRQVPDEAPKKADAQDSDSSDSDDDGDGDDGDGDDTDPDDDGKGDDSADSGSDATPTPTPRGTKRSRSNFAPAVGPAPKRTKYPIPEVQIQMPVDIARLALQPLRITYKLHPDVDRTDNWFVDNIKLLFKQMNTFFTHYYALHNLADTEEPWALTMTPEFLKWAEQVAEPDPQKGWDELLKDAMLRKWFVMAIVMKVFKVKVFDHELFGATKEQKDLVHNVDVALLLREGFGRTELRARTARTIIGANPVTEAFYPAVATLTAQIHLMLEPLTTYLYAKPAPVGKKLPLVQDLYQSLHNLVSQAAYLSLCVRMSPTILQFYDTTPGSNWEDKDMYCLETADYTKSKDAEIAAHTQRHIDWFRLYHPLSETLKDLDQLVVDNIVSKTDKVHNDAFTAVARSLAQQPIAPGRTHRALTKISVWPVITRYKPGGDADDKEPNKPLLEKDGFRIFYIAKAAVLCYYGRENVPQHDKIRLADFVKTKQGNGQKGKGVFRADGPVSAVARSLAAASAVGGMAYAFGDQAVAVGALENVFQFVGFWGSKIGVV